MVEKKEQIERKRENEIECERKKGNERVRERTRE